MPTDTFSLDGVEYEGLTASVLLPEIVRQRATYRVPLPLARPVEDTLLGDWLYLGPSTVPWVKARGDVLDLYRRVSGSAFTLAYLDDCGPLGWQDAVYRLRASVPTFAAWEADLLTA